MRWEQIVQGKWLSDKGDYFFSIPNLHSNSKQIFYSFYFNWFRKKKEAIQSQPWEKKCYGVKPQPEQENKESEGFLRWKLTYFSPS